MSVHEVKSTMQSDAVLVLISVAVVLSQELAEGR